MLTGTDMSPADYAALNDRRGGMFGGDSAWWIVILFLFRFSGNMGWDGMRNGGINDNYVLTSDFATMERKIDSVNNGLCSGFYEQARLIDNTNLNMANGFATAELSRANQYNDLTHQIYGVQNAQQAGMYENRQAIEGVKYHSATNTRDIIEAGNQNTREILDALSRQQMEAKDAKIQEQAGIIQSLNLAASQCAQNQYLISQLKQPCPVPAFQVPNPYANYDRCGYCGC